jgi:hypothetical protein
MPVWHYALRLRTRRRSGVDGRRHARRTTGSFRDACSEAAIPLPGQKRKDSRATGVLPPKKRETIDAKVVLTSRRRLRA